MFTKVYWTREFDNKAKLGIMARPRGDSWLADEIANFWIISLASWSDLL